MMDDVGRVPDGTGLSQAEPVSRLGPTGFDPSRVRVVRLPDQIRAVAERWKEQYGREFYKAAYHHKTPQTYGQIYDALTKLDVESATAADVEAIIGNDSWIGENCDFCGARLNEYLEIGDQPDYDARWVAACFPCAEHIAAIATEARRAETVKLGSIRRTTARAVRHRPYPVAIRTPQMKAELEALAVRCEEAAGPDRELDCDILEYEYQERYGRGVQWIDEGEDLRPRHLWVAGGPWEDVPYYTSSLDAAMTLVPEGWRVVRIGEEIGDEMPWHVRLSERKEDMRQVGKTGDAATPALALTAAALRARSRVE